MRRGSEGDGADPLAAYLRPPMVVQPIDRPPEATVRLALRVLLQLEPTPPPAAGLLLAPFGTTQEGLARQLGVTQGAVSKVLVRLAAAGVIRQGAGHVPGVARRVRVYSLTTRGSALVRAYRERIGTPAPPGAPAQSTP